jgi:hypothetical protein
MLVGMRCVWLQLAYVSHVVSQSVVALRFEWGRKCRGDRCRHYAWCIIARYTSVDRGVTFSCRLAVGFRDVMIPGASEIRGMVRMSSLSITLCSFSCVAASLTLCCSKVTLCSEGVGGGASTSQARPRIASIKRLNCRHVPSRPSVRPSRPCVYRKYGAVLHVRTKRPVRT